MSTTSTLCKTAGITLIKIDGIKVSLRSSVSSCHIRKTRRGFRQRGAMRERKNVFHEVKAHTCIHMFSCHTDLIRADRCRSVGQVRSAWGWSVCFQLLGHDKGWIDTHDLVLVMFQSGLCVCQNVWLWRFEKISWNVSAQSSQLCLKNETQFRLIYTL